MSDQGTPQDPGAWGQQPGQQPPPPPPPPPPYGQPPQPPAPPPDYPQQYPTQQYPPQPDYGQQYPPQQPGQPGYGDTAQLPPGYGQPAYGAPPPPGGPGGPGVPGQEGGKGRRGLFAGLGVVAVAILAVLAYFLFFAGSSGAGTPQDAVKKLFDAGKTLDVNKAMKVLCKADKSNTELTTFTKPTESDRVKSYTIGTVTKKDSDHATVRVSVVTKGESKAQSADLPVKKEGGKWKVCVSDMFANLPTSLPTGFSSGIPSEFPTNLIPTGLPTEVTDLPSGLPSGLPTSGICASAEDALTPAETYMGLASFGFTSVAQACVYQDSVPQSVTARLSGGTLYTPGQDKTGDDNHGPKGEYDFTSIDGSKKVTVTVTKQSDGKYYVTGVDIH